MKSSLSATQLLSIEDLSDSDIQTIFSLAGTYLSAEPPIKESRLKGALIVTLFFEPSTRTRTSFEIAGKRLSADVVNISMESSSTKKGENFLDTVRTIDAMRPDILIIRHSMSGAVASAAEYVNARVINAGDGCHEHPTQALLDAFTILAQKGSVKGKTIAICGDILHSRVARSNIALLTRLGAHIRLIAPPTLLPKHLEQALGLPVFHRMEEGVKDADVVMMLRLQRERMQSCFVPSVREYFYCYGLSRERLSLAKPDVLVLHPGPMNRGVEIASDVADDPRLSSILAQVSSGVAIRQAVLALLGERG